MFNLISTIKSHNGMSHCFSSMPKFYIRQINRFSLSPANAPKLTSADSTQHSFAATYLRNTHGIPPEKALRCSRYLRFDSSERPDSIITFFKSQHLTDAQITSIVRKWPLVFRYTPESLLPKIEYLRSLGFSTSDLIKVLKFAPTFLGSSLKNQIIPSVVFLRSFLCNDKDVVLSIMRFPDVLRRNLQNILLPNVEILRHAGVPKPQISILFRFYPRIIAARPESFRVTVEEVQKLGFNPQKNQFIVGVTVMGQMSSSTWREKMDHYKRWGWSEHQVLDAFRKQPWFMATSKDKSTKIMNHFASKEACGLSILLRRPRIFSLSFAKTIAPRCSFYQVLLSEGLIKDGSSLLTMLECPERLFVGRYVARFEKEAPHLLRLYREIFSSQEE